MINDNKIFCKRTAYTHTLKRCSSHLYAACIASLLFCHVAHSAAFQGSFQQDTSHPTQRGLASWYGGPRFQLKRTAQGSLFDHNTLIAAHPTLPFGTKVVVHSPRTHRSILVTIMDRGPFREHRIIDLSRMAAERLGILRHGVSPVSITVVKANSPSPSPLSHQPISSSP